MMAFFLVMWICGQDQKIKRAVSFYFQDPLGQAAASSKKPLRAGALTELANTGDIPESESVALASGRKSYTPDSENGVATKLVGDWVFSDQETNVYWRQQAQQQRAAAAQSKDVALKRDTTERVAARQLAKQLRDEFRQGIPGQVNDLCKNLLKDSLNGVNWLEIAEDLLAHP
jgi:hypothetical protein